ncbi:hypothetical protein BAE44_0011675 [Dichanthelium oligosanthes]|uniref:Uncharacterized protein n=1 Tax=Dichanthelium oligosanthes TaxID=888268 RepID=A0A1E5VQD4_9POAL|nr:hypothetical protein BAE44_0011675 [Dichanthelium oligosanthes]
MDIFEASTLESKGKNSIDEHERFFLEKPQDPCSHNASLESVTFFATSMYKDYNHLKVLVCKRFRMLVVDALVYHKHCKSRGGTCGTNLAATLQ